MTVDEARAILGRTDGSKEVKIMNMAGEAEEARMFVDAISGDVYVTFP